MILDSYPAPSINIQNKLMTFDQPKVMGILNLTPDSFYDGGRYYDKEAAVRHATRLIEEGADIIDIGAYSSRPGAIPMSVAEETDRALPVIDTLRIEFPHIPLSIDTYRAEVARQAVLHGAGMINDISGGTLDDKMFDTVAELDVPYVLMHMRGTPETMQQTTEYHDLITDIAVFFGERVAILESLGVKDVILDPGFGFAKTTAQNYELLHRLDELHYFNLPILGGLSRKSMIYKKLGITPKESLNGTIALNSLLLYKGVKILRVHDVKEAKQLIKLLS